MDARITKYRLGNMLSYDWLKIVISIVVAVLALVVFFTTVQTRPGRTHVFTVFGYREIVAGSDARTLTDDMEARGVFSYDILETRVETFGENTYSEQAFAARRSAGEGSVLFTTTNAMTTRNEAGEEVETTVLQWRAGGESTEFGYDVVQFFRDCENYLVRFFGADYKTDPHLDEEEAERCFLKRNGKDKRYRKAANREQGILDERARLEKLRDDYIAVMGCFEGDKPLFDLEYVTDNNGNQRAAAIGLGGLSDGFKALYYYNDPAGETSGPLYENVCLVLLRNDGDAGKAQTEIGNDLRYEPVSFLRYLAERYGA